MDSFDYNIDFNKYKLLLPITTFSIVYDDIFLNNTSRGLITFFSMLFSKQ